MQKGECGQFIAHANRTLFENAKPAFGGSGPSREFSSESGAQGESCRNWLFGSASRTGPRLHGFYLDPSDRTSSKLSAQRAREIYDAAGEGKNKPFIVLMSSIPDVKSQADEFS